MTLSFQSRILLFFSSLFIGIQVLTLIPIYWVCRENIVKQIGQNLLYAENIFNRSLTEHGERMASGTRVLVADFGFRTTISDGDQETISSALENLTYRIRGERGFYIDLQGKIVADTASRQLGQLFMFPDAIKVAEAEGKSVVFGMLDGKLSEISVVPVLAPLPIGWVGVAIAVDQNLLESFQNMSTLPPDISLVELSGGKLQILSSSVINPSMDFFQQRIFSRPLTDFQYPSLVLSSHDAFLVLIRPLAPAKAEQAILAVLQINLATALHPYVILVYAVLGLFIFGLLATLIGAYLLARKIAEPVRALAGATQRIMDGHFDEPLPITRDDELGRLAETFNSAKRIAAEMSDLKQQDQLRRELVASVSHDLRTPLTALHGYLETMQLRANNLPEEERQRFLAVAVRQSEKLGRMAQELFELAKLECEATRIQFENFNILELIQDVAQKYEMAAKVRGIDLQAKLDCEFPPVCADIAMIERVLTNLIDNALRHTPCGGKVNIVLFRKDKRIRISVSDNGEGIAPEYLPKLFERDSPLRHRPAGTNAGGLGLLIVAKMVALHGGAVDVKSTLGAGSEFSFDLAMAI